MSEPAALGNYATLGDPAVLDKRKIGLICSVKCPGSVILQTYDLMRGLRNDAITVISGFHSPMERECLNILLRGTCGVVVCPARTLPQRMPSEFEKPIDDGRMLLLSAFDEKHNRTTAETSACRNRMVARISDVVVVPYAAEGGKTEALCREIAGTGVELFVLPGAQSANIADLGVETISAENLDRLLIMQEKGAAQC